MKTNRICTAYNFALNEIEPFYKLQFLCQFFYFLRQKALNNKVVKEPYAQTIIDLYTKGEGRFPDYANIFAQEVTDLFFVCPNRAMAR